MTNKDKLLAIKINQSSETTVRVTFKYGNLLEGQFISRNGTDDEKDLEKGFARFVPAKSLDNFFNTGSVFFTKMLNLDSINFIMPTSNGL